MIVNAGRFCFLLLVLVILCADREAFDDEIILQLVSYMQESFISSTCVLYELSLLAS